MQILSFLNYELILTNAKHKARRLFAVALNALVGLSINHRVT